MLLQHCDLLDDAFDANVVKAIFELIQQSATDLMALAAENEEEDEVGGDDKDDQEGVDDDDELSFSEFLDGLVAIVMYKDPNPFVPFHVRVDFFLLDSFFASLRHYWSRSRHTDRSHLKRLLNALQKKVRNDGERHHETDDQVALRKQRSKGSILRSQKSMAMVLDAGPPDGPTSSVTPASATLASATLGKNPGS